MNIKIKFGLLSLIVILFQSVLKLIGVVLTGSLSFLSETIDTITDIFFVSITIYSVFKSEKPPDMEHMYGHSKIDPIGATIQGIFLINIYGLLIFNAIQIIITGVYEITNPELGLLILLLSFLVNLIFSRILIWQGKKSYSLTLKIQGLNLFQDSMRAILVIVSFIFTLFGIFYLDPFISIALSVWIIFGALKLAKDGINDLSDTNPIKSIILEELRLSIFNLDHVIGVQELKIRASGKKLFLEMNLSVEDHISVVHANEVSKSIRAMSKKLFPLYDVECLIEMNPLAGESSISENLHNLIFSMKPEFPSIINIKDVNIFSFENKYFVSLVAIVDEKLSLEAAHEICSRFERDLKEQAPYLSRIITHIEGEAKALALSKIQVECVDKSPERMEHLKEEIERILRKNDQVKGFHGLELWTTPDSCTLELHVFFEGSLNISEVHQNISELEQKIKENITIDKLHDIILHSEPFKGRKEGHFF